MVNSQAAVEANQPQVARGCTMPWEIKIRRDDSTPLGDREAVKRFIADAFPGVEFYWELSGPEKLAIAAKKAIEFPEILRRHFESAPAKEQGDFDGVGFTVRFYLGAAADTLQSVAADVRGETQLALPLLRRLTEQEHWVVAEQGRKEHFFP